MIRQQASQAWLWQNEVLSDMRLQLCTVQPAPDSEQQGLASPATEDEGGNVPDTADAQAVTRSAKVARRNEGSATAPELASAAEAEAAAVAAAAAAAAAAAVAAAAAAAGGAGIRPVTFCLHANIMASSSPYFKKRITESASGSSGALRYADTGVGTDTAGGGLLLVERVEEGEVAAMEAVLRHCYTYQLCDAGGDASQLTVPLLLQMLALSDRFDVALCAQHCCEELAGRGAAEYTVEVINTVLGGLPPGVRACAAFPAVEAAATAHLLHLLGDVDAIHERACAGDASLTQQLRRLSLPSLLALLGSDRLTALSENSVVVTASDWMFRAPAAAACGAAELRQVAVTLRLSRVSPTYLLEVLPRLEWLHITPAERESLLAYVAAGAGGEADVGGRPEANIGRLRQAALLTGGLVSGPAAWYSTDARPTRHPLGVAPDQLAWRWKVTTRELKELLQEAGGKGVASVKSPDRFFHGFCLQMYVWVDGGPEEWQARLGVAFHGPMATSVGGGAALGDGDAAGIDDSRVISCKTLFADATVKVLLAAGGEDEGVEEAGFWVGHIRTVNLFTPLALLPRSPHVLDPASWGPYLRDGNLCLSCTVRCC